MNIICSICLYEIDEANGLFSNIKELGCRHKFHENCLKKWKGNTCPNCRLNYDADADIDIELAEFHNHSADQREEISNRPTFTLKNLYFIYIFLLNILFSMRFTIIGLRQCLPMLLTLDLIILMISMIPIFLWSKNIFPTSLKYLIIALRFSVAILLISSLIFSNDILFDKKCYNFDYDIFVHHTYTKFVIEFTCVVTMYNLTAQRFLCSEKFRSLLLLQIQVYKKIKCSCF